MESSQYSSIKSPLLRAIVLSPYLDLFGAFLVFGVSIYRGFHKTVYHGGKVVFDTTWDQWIDFISHLGYPLGIFSIVGAVFSLLSTRLVGKQNNWGNFIGIVTTVNSGINDFLFGNASAILSYPITFIIQNFSFFNWKKGIQIRKIDTFYYLINIAGLLLAYGIVFLGFKIFGGKTEGMFFHTVAVTFGLSLGANFCTALKYEETWLSWSIYNIVQLAKNLLQHNLANVVKYIFYLFNAVVTLFDWKWNGNRDTGSPLL